LQLINIIIIIIIINLSY